MAEDADKPPVTKTISAEESLPPVEPPSAGFIVKLFVVPAVIVVLVLGVVLVFNWLVHKGSDPDSYLDSIESGAPNSWQQAHDLFYVLHQDPQHRSDEGIARRIGGILQLRIKSPPPAGKPPEDPKKMNDFRDKAWQAWQRVQAEVYLRIYLCKALGEFQTPAALPPLMAAAKLERNENERDVRLAAVEAIALLAHNIRRQGNSIGEEDHASMVDLLLETSRDESPVVRSRAAFALGMVEDPRAVERLEYMVQRRKNLPSEWGERYADARFNAATGLARQGNDKCLKVLETMIDPEFDGGASLEKEKSSRFAKKWTVRYNGLAAALLLHEQNQQADLSPLQDVVEALRRRDDIPAEVNNRAGELLNVIRNAQRQGSKTAQ